MSASTIDVYTWTKGKYENMVSKGIFHPEERLELLEGEIISMTPQGSVHATAVRLVEDTLRKAFLKGYDVRVQMPLALDIFSEPEPDIAVVTGSPRDYRDMHPSTAILIVEVADTSLSYDRSRKKKKYAENNIPEYWIINLIDICLEVYRNPVQADYQFHTTLRPTEIISPLAKPQTSITVSELFP